MRAAVLVMIAACGGGSAGKPAGDGAQTRSRGIPIDEGDADDNSDGIEVVSSRGRMDPQAIETGIGPHKANLGACFTTRVGQRRWLGGQVALQWDVQRDGAVTAVRLAESNLGAWPIEKCLLDVARAATFGKPIGGDADFSIPLEFTARGRAEVWDEDQSLAAIGGQLATLDACSKGKRAPDDVTITLYVGPQGKAQSVGFASASAVVDDGWADCAESAVLAWKLPDPRGTVAKLAIRYRAEK